MSYGRYLISFDENRQPFIAHVGTQKSHKYIAKVIENGRPRYFYTQEEYNAYLKNKNRPKSQAERDKELREKTKQLQASIKDNKDMKQATERIKAERQKNAAKLKEYENAYAEAKKKDMSIFEKGIYEDAISELKETDKEWAMWEEAATQISNQTNANYNRNRRDYAMNYRR